jgi:hypothetical protein
LPKSRSILAAKRKSDGIPALVGLGRAKSTKRATCSRFLATRFRNHLIYRQLLAIDKDIAQPKAVQFFRPKAGVDSQSTGLEAVSVDR